MPAPILATKLYLPPPRPEIVPRLRLVERLNEGLAAGHYRLGFPQGLKATGLLSLSCQKVEKNIKHQSVVERQLQALLNQLREGFYGKNDYLTISKFFDRYLQVGVEITLRHSRITLDTAGIGRVKFHSLRYTFVSYLLSQNTPPKDAQVFAGHSHYSTTVDIYCHIMSRAQKEAVKKMDSLIKVQESVQESH